jgi:hypothetical protein
MGRPNGWRLAATVMVVAVTAGCAAPDSGVKNSADKSTASSSGKAKAGPAKLGDAITIKGQEKGSAAQVTAVRYVATVKATDGFSTPAAGNRYAAVQFIVKNTGTVSYDDAPSNGAKVSDSENQQYDVALLEKSSAGQGLPFLLKLAPGGTAKGFLVFEVPTAAKIVSVQFSQASGFAETAEWKIA